MNVNLPSGLAGLNVSRLGEDSLLSSGSKSSSVLSSAVFGLAKGLFSTLRTIKSAIQNVFSPELHASKKENQKIEKMLEQTRAHAQAALDNCFEGITPKSKPHLETIVKESTLEVDRQTVPSSSNKNTAPAPEESLSSATEETDDEADFEAMLQQMNARQNEDAPWEIKSRIVRPKIESKVQARGDSSFKLEPAPSKSALKGQVQSHGESRKGVKWADQGEDGKLVSGEKEVEKETPFALYSQAQQEFTHVMSELDVRTTPEKGTHGWGFNVLGKTVLDKGETWNPDQVIAQGARKTKERKVFDADLKRLLKGEISPKDFSQKHMSTKKPR